MPSFRFGQNTTDAYASRQQALGSVRTLSRPATASNDNSVGAGGSSYTNNRFAPVWDNLAQGSVLEDWVPRDAAGINMMFRRIHLRDAIAGPTVDIYASSPWSEFDIAGIKDPALRRFYEEAFAMFTPDVMTQISKEFLVIGRWCASLSYNAARGYFDDFAAHDPDFLDIVPVPFRGYDPLIDIRVSPAMKNFMQSQDERVARYRALLPKAYLEKFATASAGRIPLEPLSTLFLARRIGTTDMIGTSLLSRIVGLWAIEKALMDATVTAARRRVGAIAHITAGIDGIWEPDATELDNLASLFTQAEEDQVGAVVATRTGVSVQEVRQGGQVWKISDEWAFLAEAKMRALGVSEALLAGDATFSNMETARSIFVEQILTFRNQLTKQLFDKIAVTLARTHGFINDPKRAASNGQIRVTRERTQDLRRDMEMQGRTSPYSVMADAKDEDEAFRKRISKTLSMDKALRIPQEQLVIPTIHWRKDMKPTQDQAYLELLEKMEEKGLPVPKRIYAAAGGYDIDAAIAMMPEDKKLTEQIAEATGQPPEGVGMEGMEPGMEGGPDIGLDEDVSKMDDLLGPGKGGGAEPPGEGPATPEKPPAGKQAGKNPVTNPAPPKDMKPSRNPMAYVQAQTQARTKTKIGNVKAYVQNQKKPKPGKARTRMMRGHDPQLLGGVDLYWET